MSLLGLVFLMKEERWVTGEDSNGGRGVEGEGEGEGEGIFVKYSI